MARKIVCLLVLLMFFGLSSALADIKPAQEASGQERTRELQEQDEFLRGQLKKIKVLPLIEEKTPAKQLPSKSTEQILIKDIRVSGATLISEREIKGIISPFENHKLTLADMQKISDLITQVYRDKGYVSSRAYLPPQKIASGTLEIKVLEAVVSEVHIKGNRYFKSNLLKRKIGLKKGDFFNYNILRKNLGKINAHPDIYSRAVITAGQIPGTTDIVLEVKDNLPIHVGFNLDDFGSRYIDNYRYQATLTDNNLLGFDDIFTFQYQCAQAYTYWFYSFQYLFPVTSDLKIGFSANRSKLSLAKEYKDLQARGKSKFYSVYATQSLIDTENIDLSVSAGFDYTDVFNFQLGQETSRDRLRVAKIGLDLDITDNWGRTLFTDEVGIGIPGIMGGLNRSDGGRSSRSVSSGGKFTKNTINLLRLQQMPFSSNLLWKNQIQLSCNPLTAVEQFQIGGISNVRGYPPAEAVGDKGYAMTWEWAFPPYFFPKNIQVPFSKAKFYDAFRIVGFYDWGNVHLKKLLTGERKNRTLRAAGCAFRFTLPENFFIRLDMGWPLDNLPSDGKHLHTWIQASKTF